MEYSRAKCLAGTAQAIISMAGMRLLCCATLMCISQIIMAAVTPTQTLLKADMLYGRGQYAEAKAGYDSLYRLGYWSPAMLLKMAFVAKGVGNIAEVMIYLQHYYQLTANRQVLRKIEKLSSEHHLSGYSSWDMAWFRLRYQHGRHILLGLTLIASALLVGMILSRGRMRKILGVFALLSFISLPAWQFIEKGSQQGVTLQPVIYAMQGPSAAAEVVGIIGEGHRLPILDAQDVWIKTRWKEKIVYIRKNTIFSLQ